FAAMSALPPNARRCDVRFVPEAAIRLDGKLGCGDRGRDHAVAPSGWTTGQDLNDTGSESNQSTNPPRGVIGTGKVEDQRRPMRQATSLVGARRRTTQAGLQYIGCQKFRRPDHQ